MLRKLYGSKKERIQRFKRFKTYSIINSKHITKTCLYNFDHLKPDFYIVKLGFTGVYIIFLISAQNIILSRNMKNIRFFLSEKFHFLMVKFSVYLNGHVFVMSRIVTDTLHIIHYKYNTCDNFLTIII